MKAIEHASFIRAMAKAREARVAEIEGHMKAIALGMQDLGNPERVAPSVEAIEKISAELFSAAVAELNLGASNEASIRYQMSGEEFAKELFAIAEQETKAGSETAKYIGMALEKAKARFPENVAVEHIFTMREDYCAFGKVSATPISGDFSAIKNAVGEMLAAAAEDYARSKMDEKQVPPLAAALMTPHVAAMIQPALRQAAQRVIPDTEARPFASFTVDIAKKMEALPSVEIKLPGQGWMQLSGAAAAEKLLSVAGSLASEMEEVGALSKYFGQLGM